MAASLLSVKWMVSSARSVTPVMSHAEAPRRAGRLQPANSIWRYAPQLVGRPLSIAA
jgi:hypothetical protein